VARSLVLPLHSGVPGSHCFLCFSLCFLCLSFTLCLSSSIAPTARTTTTPRTHTSVDAPTGGAPRPTPTPAAPQDTAPSEG